MCDMCINCRWLEDNEYIEDSTYEYVCKLYHCVIEDPYEEIECDSYKYDEWGKTNENKTRMPIL